MHTLRLTCLLVLTRPPLGQIYCAFFFLFFSLTRLRPESCKTRNDLSRPDQRIRFIEDRFLKIIGREEIHR